MITEDLRHMEPRILRDHGMGPAVSRMVRQTCPALVICATLVL
jgi:hypothetical protein